MSDTRLTPDEAASKIEILDLFARYCHAIDRYEFSLFEDVFTDDVVADYSDVRDPSLPKLIHGRDAFVGWLTESMAGIGPGMTHYMSNHLITLDGDEGRVVTLNHVLNVPMGGVYHSRVVRTALGWRVAEIRFEVRYFERINAMLASAMPSGQSAS